MGNFLLRVGFFLVGAIGGQIVLMLSDPWGAFQGEPACMKVVRERIAAQNKAVARATLEKFPPPKVPEIHLAANKRCLKANEDFDRRVRNASFHLGLLGWVFGGISAIWGPKAVGALFKKL